MDGKIVTGGRLALQTPARGADPHGVPDAADARRIARVAARRAGELAAAARQAPAPSGLARRGRLLALAGQALVRKGKMLLREHWDIAVFDVLFGSVKAFGVYPALYFAGLAWTIPVLEYLPLNTQLWTAGYLAARGHVLSELGRLRYGRSLAALDALRDRLLGVDPRDARPVHRFTLRGERRVLRVRRSRVRHALARWRRAPEPGVVHPSALRRLVGDAELLFRANPLRANPCLYEAVLLAQLIATPDAHAALWELSAPEPLLCDEGRALRDALGDGPEWVRARLAEQSDTLAAALRGRRDAAARRLRRRHRALRREVKRGLGEIADLEYRLLAEIADGGDVGASRRRSALCARRGAQAALLERGEQLAHAALRVGASPRRSAWRAEGLPVGGGTA